MKSSKHSPDPSTDTSGAAGFYNEAGDDVVSPFSANYSTPSFSLPKTIHPRLAIANRSVSFWLSVALPLAILIIAGLSYDVRLLFIAAAVVFILYPTLLLIAWYNILARPDAVASIFPHTVTFNTDNEIIVKFYPLIIKEKSDTGIVTSREINPPAETIIPAETISSVSLHGNYILINYPSASLIIPLEALQNPKFITYLLEFRH